MEPINRERSNKKNQNQQENEYRLINNSNYNNSNQNKNILDGNKDKNKEKKPMVSAEHNALESFRLPPTKKRGCCGKICSHISLFFLFIKLALIDYCRRKTLFCIGVLTIVLCFITSMVSQSLITKTPVIFYNTVAVLEGETDIVIYTDFNENIGLETLYMNYTNIQGLLKDVSPTEPTPRYVTSLVASSKPKPSSQIRATLKGDL